MNSIKKITKLLSKSEQRRATLLLFMIVVMAFLDVVGVASILPFMAVLANPELVETNLALNKLYLFFNFPTVESYLFFLGFVVFVMLLFSLAFKAIANYVQLRFVLMREYSIGRSLVEGYLGQSYVWFLNKNSAHLAKMVLSEVAVVLGGVLMSLMNLAAHGLTALAILALLFLVDHKLALMTILFFSLLYGVVFFLTNGFLNRIGNERLKANQVRYCIINEAFGAIKDIKCMGLESRYLDKFSRAAKIYATNQAAAQVLAQIPRFALEAIAFGGMLLVILYLMATSNRFSDALPIISLYAFAGYRLMPASHQIYSSFSHLCFIKPSLSILHEEIVSLISDGSKVQCFPDLVFTDSLVLKNIEFSYPSSSSSVLSGINLKIPARQVIGIVGTTGSGKTTLIDIILGLLQPKSGSLVLDGVLLDQTNLRSWQSLIGYVPQQIYLSDDTVAANIAFGIPQEDINQSAVEQAAKIANLHEFIVNELDSSYETLVGERGVRLSGGQRQRIGIARALYRDPKVLILDEATSALDNLTERAVMDAVNNLSHQITIILIAHRLSSVQQCDLVYMLDKGKLVANGSYAEVISQSDIFRAMSALNS